MKMHLRILTTYDIVGRDIEPTLQCWNKGDLVWEDIPQIRCRDNDSDTLEKPPC